MDPKRLNYLLEQHRLNRLSPQEEAELYAWYDKLDDPLVEPIYAEDSAEEREYVARHTRQIMDRIARQRRKRRQGMWMKVAAILLAGLIIAYLVWPEGQHKVGKGIAMTDPTQYTRYLTLPDSSTVILGEGSSLQLANGFGNTNRDLTLKGEAYFDVKHNASLPFVIQTGKVKTKVLGTAFNVKQVGDSVAVTVARGKVQVERNDKLLAVLTPGQQIATNGSEASNEVKTTALEPVAAWMQEGLHFDNSTLGAVAAQLQRRYGTDIVLTPGMEHCVITIVTPFSGSESLNTILDVICATLGASYTQTTKAIEIKGEPCRE